MSLTEYASYIPMHFQSEMVAVFTKKSDDQERKTIPLKDFITEKFNYCIELKLACEFRTPPFLDSTCEGGRLPFR